MLVGRVADSYRTILASTLGDELTPGTEETPARAAKAWAELTCGYDVDIPSLFKIFEEGGYVYDQLIALTDLPFSSLCEHHLLPFSGYAHIVYLPTEHRVLGVSKFARLLDAYARRLQVQERLTAQIADEIQEHLKPQGVMVVVEAHHLCMSCRGVRSAGVMRTSALREKLYEPTVRTEAEWLIGRSRTT